jgi:ABC-type transport system involved in multi-copper enzyme maturation permease subunit
VIRIIALRELQDHVLSLRFYLALALCFVLIVVGAVVLSEEQAQRREMLEPFLKADQYREVAQWASANSLMNGGLFLTRPLPRLRALVHGLEELSLIAQVKGANYLLYMREPLVGNPVGKLFSSFDLVFVVGVLLSLVALAFTCDGVAGESEEGTLRLVLSNGVSRGQVLAGKWLGAFASLAVLLAPCLLAGVAIAASHPRAGWGAGEGWVMLAVFGACLLYVAVFVSLGLLVSCVCRQARAALVGGLVVWALLIWVVPSFAPHLGAWMVESDPALMVEANVNGARAGAEREGWEEVSRFIGERGWGEEAAAKWNLEWGTWSDAIPRLLEELRDEADRKALAEFSTRVMREQLKEMEALATQIEEADRQRRRGQAMLGQVLSCISPLPPFTYLLTDLSRTGLRGEFLFRRSVERFKGELVNYLYRQMEDRSVWDRVEAGEFPYFAYKDQSAQVGPEAFVHALVLVIYGVGLFLGAHAVFLRYEV